MDTAEAPADEDGFAAALAATIEHEGGWVLSRDSDGAAVYCGVNKRANPTWAGWSHLPDAAPARRRKIDTPELRRLVGKVYKKRYWASRICEFCAPWPILRAHVFDCAVNHGHAGAVMRLQEACQRQSPDISADGKMGPATEGAIRALVEHLGEAGANNLLVATRVAFYQRLGSKPGRKRYVKGWTARAESYVV